jgi:hypothetical protein
MMQRKDLKNVSKFRNKPYRNVGDPSSKYGYDKDGKQFEADIQAHIESYENLYREFKNWMKSKDVTPDVFRRLFVRYYDEFIKGC